MQIRTATNLDLEGIQTVYLQAFSEEEREVVANLAINLLAAETSPPTFALVAEAENHHCIVGHIAFSSVSLKNNDQFQGYILAPLAVSPQHQNQGIGSMLIEAGLQQLSQINVDMAFVYGDRQYYGRFGFDTKIATRYSPPYELQYPFGWQAIALNGFQSHQASGELTCVAALNNPQLW